MDNLTFRNNLSMDNVTVYMETVYNSSNSTNSTRNLNKNRKKSNQEANNADINLLTPFTVRGSKSGSFLSTYPK